MEDGDGDNDDDDGDDDDDKDDGHAQAQARPRSQQDPTRLLPALRLHADMQVPADVTRRCWQTECTLHAARLHDAKCSLAPPAAWRLGCLRSGSSS
jgi:hypothetical protein